MTSSTACSGEVGISMPLKESNANCMYVVSDEDGDLFTSPDMGVVNKYLGGGQEGVFPDGRYIRVLECIPKGSVAYDTARYLIALSRVPLERYAELKKSNDFTACRGMVDAWVSGASYWVGSSGLYSMPRVVGANTLAVFHANAGPYFTLGVVMPETVRGYPGALHTVVKALVEEALRVGIDTYFSREATLSWYKMSDVIGNWNGGYMND